MFKNLLGQKCNTKLTEYHSQNRLLTYILIYKNTIINLKNPETLLHALHIHIYIHTHTYIHTYIKTAVLPLMSCRCLVDEFYWSKSPEIVGNFLPSDPAPPEWELCKYYSAQNLPVSSL